MAETLLIRLPRTPQQAPTWVVVDARGAAAGPAQSGPLSLAAPRAAGRRVCVLVPGPDVLVTHAEVPARAGAKLAQLVPYALEEQLAEDIDALHFAIARRPAEGARVPVAVVSRRLMDEWLGALRNAGIAPDLMYADSDLLPQNPGQATALLEEDVITVRPAAGTPVTLPADALAEALLLAQGIKDGIRDGAEENIAGRGLILYTGAAEWQQHSAQVEAGRERFDGIRVQLLTHGPLALFAQQLPTALPTNLLQGDYATQSSRSAGWRAWRVAALLAVCLLGLHVAGKAAQLGMLKRQERTLDAAIRDTARTALPGETPSGDVRRRMEQRLAALRDNGTSGLLPALEALAHAGSAAPGMQLQSLNFHNGTLELKLSAPDASSLDKVAQSLKSNGWPAELTGGNAVGSRYEGRIQVHAP